MNRIPSVLVQDNLILGGQRSGKDENGIPDYNDGGSDMDLLMLSAGILDVLEALPYTRATFGTCVGSSLCQCNCICQRLMVIRLGYWPTCMFVYGCHKIVMQKISL